MASRVASLTPPVKGMVLNRPLSADPGGNAELVENFIPTTRGLRIRGGSLKSAYITDAVLSLWNYAYSGAETLFAASATDLYDISALDAENAATSLMQLTGGYFSSAQIGTAGGFYQYMVNGTDYAMIFDGTDVNPVTDEAISDLAYDGLVTDFEVGETVSGGTSGASAEIMAIVPTTATTGTLKIGTITSGPFQNDETITSASGEATANGASASASTTTITGVDTSTLSQVWKFKNTLFFVEDGTLRFWYLPAGSIGGAATSFSLAGVFQRGGEILFGATWSTDAGDGMDDTCVIVSDQGEVAIYQGSDPDDAETWALVGRYDIAPPLGKNAHITAGGDLLIATKDGVIPLSQVRMKDPAALSFSAVSRAIEPIWEVEAARATGNVQLVKWSDNNLMLVVLPDAARMLTANLQTGAWAQQKAGWVGDCAVVHEGNAYVGAADGYIRRIDTTGIDDGVAYVARYAHSSLDFGSPVSFKMAQMVRYSFFSTFSFTYKAEIGVNHNVEFGSSPDFAVTEFNVLFWDNGQNWDDGILWGSDDEDSKEVLTTEWRSVAGSGHSLAPMLQITSTTGAKLDVELVQIDIAYEQGGAVV